VDSSRFGESSVHDSAGVRLLKVGSVFYDHPRGGRSNPE
jgi:hypothetical protein